MGKVSWLYINLPDYYFAGTTADLWMGIRQGGIECTTKRPTWDAPDDGEGKYWRKPYGCYTTFDMDKDIELYLYSDSSNDVFVTHMAAKIGGDGGKYKTWYSKWSPPMGTGKYYAEIDKYKNNGWWTARGDDDLKS